MKDFFENVLVILLIISLIILVLFIVSVPFTLIGWVLLLAINLFVTVSITYFNSFILGLSVAIVSSIFRR